MADAALVRGGEPGRDLERVVEGLAHRDRSRLDVLPESPALQELHDHVGDAGFAAEVVDREDVGMVQRGRRLGLPLEARELLLVRARLRQRLERDGAIEVRVFGEEHLPHSSLADHLQDVVMRDLLADHPPPPACSD